MHTAPFEPAVAQRLSCGSSPHIEVLTLQPAAKIAAITAFHALRAFARYGLARELKA